MTYTFATLELPPAVFDLIKETMEELGQQHRFTKLNHTPSGQGITAIDFDGIAITAGVDDCRDMFINSGRLSDLLVGAGEEAFQAGFEAGFYHDKERDGWTSYYPAWSEYTPSDAIHDLQADLTKETF